MKNNCFLGKNITPSATLASYRALNETIGSRSARSNKYKRKSSMNLFSSMLLLELILKA